MEYLEYNRQVTEVKYQVKNSKTNNNNNYNFKSNNNNYKRLTKISNAAAKLSNKPKQKKGKAKVPLYYKVLFLFFFKCLWEKCKVWNDIANISIRSAALHIFMDYSWGFSFLFSLFFSAKVFKAFKFSNIKNLLNTFNWQFSISFYRLCNKDFVCSQLLTLSTESWQFQHHLTRVSLIQLTLKRSWIKNPRVKLPHIIWTIPFELWTRTRGQKGCSCLELSWQL